MKTKTPEKITVAIIGQADFCSRIKAALKKIPQCGPIYSGNPAEGWSLVLENRPAALFLEVGFSHGPAEHKQLRAFINQIKERFNNEIYVALAVPDCEKFSYAGDLLFEESDSGAGSDQVDCLLFNPPPERLDYQQITDQLPKLLELIALERLAEGKTPLPKLNNGDWVQSAADSQSLELWMRWIPRYAGYTNESPLIIGETGSGKTKVAYALHKLSGRKGNFVSITPRDFSSSELVQAELFGAVPGAYTGAVDKWGLVKSAEKGTLFIDELQSIDKDLQGKLITFIENKCYRRVGSSESIAADVRFIFASNQSIDQMISANILRDDFAYRLERVQVKLPPLKQRRLDIPAALCYALSKIHRQRPNSKKITGFTSRAYRMLFAHDWPGNLRQLENMVAQLCDLADIDGKRLIDESHILSLIGSRIAAGTANGSEVLVRAAAQLLDRCIIEGFESLEKASDYFNERARFAALEASNGEPEQAAVLLNSEEKLLSLSNFKRKQKKPAK